MVRGKKITETHEERREDLIFLAERSKLYTRNEIIKLIKEKEGILSGSFIEVGTSLYNFYMHIRRCIRIWNNFEIEYESACKDAKDFGISQEKIEFYTDVILSKSKKISRSDKLERLRRFREYVIQIKKINKKEREKKIKELDDLLHKNFSFDNDPELNAKYKHWEGRLNNALSSSNEEFFKIYRSIKTEFNTLIKEKENNKQSSYLELQKNLDRKRRERDSSYYEKKFDLILQQVYEDSVLFMPSSLIQKKIDEIKGLENKEDRITKLRYWRNQITGTISNNELSLVDIRDLMHQLSLLGVSNEDLQKKHIEIEQLKDSKFHFHQKIASIRNLINNISLYSNSFDKIINSLDDIDFNDYEEKINNANTRYKQYLIVIRLNNRISLLDKKLFVSICINLKSLGISDSQLKKIQDKFKELKDNYKITQLKSYCNYLQEKIKEYNDLSGKRDIDLFFSMPDNIENFIIDKDSQKIHKRKRVESILVDNDQPKKKIRSLNDIYNNKTESIKPVKDVQIETEKNNKFIKIKQSRLHKGIKKQLIKDNIIDIKEVSGDGNCFYHTILAAPEIVVNRIRSIIKPRGGDISVIELRNYIADYLQAILDKDKNGEEINEVIKKEILDFILKDGVVKSHKLDNSSLKNKLNVIGVKEIKFDNETKLTEISFVNGDTDFTYLPIDNTIEVTDIIYNKNNECIEFIIDRNKYVEYIRTLSVWNNDISDLVSKLTSYIFGIPIDIYKREEKYSLNSGKDSSKSLPLIHDNNHYTLGVKEQEIELVKPLFIQKGNNLEVRVQNLERIVKKVIENLQQKPIQNIIVEKRVDEEVMSTISTKESNNNERNRDIIIPIQESITIDTQLNDLEISEVSSTVSKFISSVDKDTLMESENSKKRKLEYTVKYNPNAKDIPFKKRFGNY